MAATVRANNGEGARELKVVRSLRLGTLRRSPSSNAFANWDWLRFSRSSSPSSRAGRLQLSILQRTSDSQHRKQGDFEPGPFPLREEHRWRAGKCSGGKGG